MTRPVWRLRLENETTLIGTLENAPSGAVLCFSMMAPVQALSGGKRLVSVGGYTEISVGTEPFSIAFEDPDFKIFNKGWLPVNPYLSIKNQPSIDVEIAFDWPEETIAPPNKPAEYDGLRLVPKPQSWEPETGILRHNGFSPTGDFSDALLAVDALAIRNEFGVFLGGDTPLNVETDATLPIDGYRLNIQEDHVTITASSRTSAFYAAISLLVLHINHNAKIPCGTITDAPRFEWRGQQIDCARHFFQPETLMELLDLMALLKLNKFHWHFNDDEAFRLEVKCYPEIWQKTRLRGEGHLMPGVFGGTKQPTGGSYSLDFTKDMIARAADLEIDVLPEIEIPAHAYALTRIYPQLRDSDDNTEETSVQGYKANTMNPAMPFTWEFIENLTRELAEIFPMQHIHLGCDERPPDAWRNSPKARVLMAEHSLETLDDLQGWMIEKAAKIVRNYGCQPCAWEEAVKGSNGGIGNDAILFSWTGQGPGLEAARAGYKVVMCPAQNLYFDMAQGEGFMDSGGRWAGAVTLQDTVNWHPVPPDEPELEANILGVEAAFWAEFTNTDQAMYPMLLPRILGVSEMGWRSKADPATSRSITQAAEFCKSMWVKHLDNGL